MNFVGEHDLRQVCNLKYKVRNAHYVARARP